VNLFSSTARLSSLARGLLGAVAGAMLGAGASGVLDAVLAAAGSGGSAPLSACVGLVAPLAVVLALLVWVGRLVFSGGEALKPQAWWSTLPHEAGAERAAWLLLPPLAALGLPLWLLAVSGVATRALAADVSGRAGGALLPLSALPLALALFAGARLAVTAGARRKLAGFSPHASVVAAGVALVLALSLLIGLGETSGGGGPLRILGVLRRQELDLRAPCLLLLVAGCAWCWPSPRGAASVALAAVLALSPLLLTWQAARGGSLGEAEALLVERHAPLSRGALALLRRASDRDGDGVSAAFAGGDCNDADARVSPRVVDEPGNGRDEDCDGSDAKLPPVTAPQAEDVVAGPWLRQPPDLNLLFVTIDTLRADLGYMGYSRPVSKHLDALAAQGVVFERAYSMASYTGKSMGPLMIGKYASELEGGFLHFNRYSKRETFVQERLRAAGVRTLSVQGYWYFFKDAGFERGFDVIDSSAAPKVAAIEGDQSSNSDEQSDAAIKLLDAPELAQRRFFMWIHYVDPHAEYAPHPEHDFGPKPRDRYDGEVAFVDQQLGRVLAALESKPFGARTAVIVTSDHGEAFGEHGMIRHGFELWEELVRVPLIVKVPGVPPRRVSARRSGIDVVPTILELMQVEAPSGAQALSGQSLVPDLVRTGGPDPERPVFMDMARGPHNAERQALIERDLKLVASEGRVLGVFDLRADPGEKRDLGAASAEGISMLAAFKQARSRLRRVAMPQP
jgi:choline-sulfatase